MVSTRTEIDELQDLLDEYLHVDEIIPLRYFMGPYLTQFEPEWFHVKGLVRHNICAATATADEGTRRFLFVRAEMLLSALKTRGWLLTEVPEIALGGYLDRPEQKVIHECRVELSVMRELAAR